MYLKPCEGLLKSFSYGNDSGSEMRRMFPSQKVINVKFLLFLDYFISV